MPVSKIVSKDHFLYEKYFLGIKIAITNNTGNIIHNHVNPIR